MAVTRTTLEPVLKELYPSGFPTTLYYQDFPLYGMLAKKGNLGGDLTKIPLRQSVGMGRSKTFSDASGNKTAEVYKAWLIRSSQDYAYQTITRKMLKEANGNPQAFVRSLTEVVNGRIWSLTESIAVDLYRDGTGSRGAIASVSAANPAVLTMENAADIVNIEVGMTVEVRNDAALGTVRDLGDASEKEGEVTAVDRLAGTFTIDVDNSSNGDTVSAGDLVFVVGDYAVQSTGADSTADTPAFVGLQGWLPSTVASNDSFFGVNRSSDRTRLAGIYKDYSSSTIEEALVQTGRLIKRESNKVPDLILMNDDKVAQLILEVGSKVERAERQVGEFSFGTLKLNLNGGQVEILSDRNCPVNEAFILKMDTWGLHHAPGELIEIVDEDGHMLQRESTSDGFEIRAACYHQLVCYDPVCNGRVLLPSS